MQDEFKPTTFSHVKSGEGDWRSDGLRDLDFQLSPYGGVGTSGAPRLLQQPRP